MLASRENARDELMLYDLAHDRSSGLVVHILVGGWFNR